MKSIQKVVIERAEGITGHYTMQPRTFEGETAEEQGNAWLREIAKTAPKTGGYDKTDVVITLSNGQDYSFRFDVQHTSLPDNDTNLRDHMRTWFLFNCRPEEIPHIAKEPRRLKRAQEMTSPEEKAEAAQLVALLDADLLCAACATGIHGECHNINPNHTRVCPCACYVNTLDTIVPTVI